MALYYVAATGFIDFALAYRYANLDGVRVGSRRRGIYKLKRVLLEGCTLLNDFFNQFLAGKPLLFTKSGALKQFIDSRWRWLLQVLFA